ncbi:hypothetical protein [Micromonospora sp. RTGN7]|nr:hypothetical protein [Micromonospora sp. RTGN7]
MPTEPLRCALNADDGRTFVQRRPPQRVHHPDSWDIAEDAVAALRSIGL